MKKKRKLPLKMQTSAKRRLKIHQEELPFQQHWLGKFASEGKKSQELFSIQLDELDKLERRIKRLTTYINRKSK